MFGLFIALIILLSGTENPGDAEKDATYDERLSQAISYFYDAEWDKSRSLLSELKSERPGDTSPYFFDSMIPFWGYFFGGNDSEKAHDFLNRSQTAIEVSERRLREAPRDTSTVLLLSGLYGYRSLVAAAENQYRTAIRSGMTGFTYTRQLLSMDSSDPNAKMGRGIFNYMMGSIPSGVSWATSFAGMSGDKEEGFRQLEEAAQADSFVSTDALMILTYLYLEEERFQEALNSAKKLSERHPSNAIFQYYLGKAFEQNGKEEEAGNAYREVVNLNNRQLTGLTQSARDRLEYLSASLD